MDFLSIFGDLIAEVEGDIKKLEDEALSMMQEKVGKDSGALHDSLEIERNKDYSIIGVNSEKLINDPRNEKHVDYSLWHHDGHGGFWLRPQNARALTWVDRRTGKRQFSKGHYIPPYPGNPFVSETYQILKSKGW